MECPHLAECAKVTEIIPSSNAQGTLQCSGREISPVRNETQDGFGHFQDRPE